VAGARDAAAAPTPGGSVELTPDEEAAWEAGLERVAEENRRAIRDPGPSWKEWFLYDGAKWWVALVFLIVDSWIVTGWFSYGTITRTGVLGAVLSLVLALYLEVLAYRLLWRRPSEDGSRRGQRFRPGWTALREVGFWTPEAARFRAGGPRPAPEDSAPDHRDFL
jgi:hypothetical protein